MVWKGWSRRGFPSIVAFHPGTEATRSRRTCSDDESVTTRSFDGLTHLTEAPVPGASTAGKPEAGADTKVAIDESGTRYSFSFPM